MTQLKNKIIVNTQADASSKKLNQLLIQEGAVVLSFPTVKTVQLPLSNKSRQIYASLNDYNILIFTSKMGVCSFFERMKKAQQTTALPAHTIIAVIGAKTGAELGRYGHQAAYVNPGNTSDEFLSYLKKEIITNTDKILLALGNLAPNKLTDGFKNIAKVERMDVYQTIIEDNINSVVLQQILNKQFDAALFTSPSAFQKFMAITNFSSSEILPPIVSIGNTTTQYIEAMGFQVAATASHATVEGLCEALLNI